jgi:uncharacterized protein YehS (DUF1456 family)
MSARGRPRKTVPTTLPECTSVRDFAKVTGLRRRFITTALAIAEHVSEDEFERVVEAEHFRVSDLELMARRRSQKALFYERCCSHCGGLLRIENAR